MLHRLRHARLVAVDRELAGAGFRHRGSLTKIEAPARCVDLPVHSSTRRRRRLAAPNNRIQRMFGCGDHRIHLLVLVDVRELAFAVQHPQSGAPAAVGTPGLSSARGISFPPVRCLMRSGVQYIATFSWKRLATTERSIDIAHATVHSRPSRLQRVLLPECDSPRVFSIHSNPPDHRCRRLDNDGQPQQLRSVWKHRRLYEIMVLERALRHDARDILRSVSNAHVLSMAESWRDARLFRLALVAARPLNSAPTVGRSHSSRWSPSCSESPTLGLSEPQCTLGR